MYLLKLSLTALAFLGAAKSVTAASSNLNKCKSGTTDFTDGLGDWKEETGQTHGWEITSNGLEMYLEAPKSYIRKTNSSDSDNPYNEDTAPYAPNFQADNMIHYGKVTYNVKAAGTAGVVTAAILMAPGGDEIDFEMLGANHNKVQTNYFFGSNPIYGVNGGNENVNIDTSTGYVNYTINWTPEMIQWSVAGKVIRTTTKKDACKSKSNCGFPTHPTAIQIGIWDASNPSSTAQWAGGPINWNKAKSVTAYVKSVTVECDPNYNEVI